ncbi:MAG: DUF1987 domain-containing protein [Bacteroidia bacterium]|nr:DUF1987 domain-containing protein [Bacteroidia bacterium]
MKFHIPSTLYTPEIWADPIARQVFLRGACFPEDSVAFFQPFRLFIQENLSDFQKGPTLFHVELTYINSSGQRELYQVLHELLQNGIEVGLVIYLGEEEELDDLRHVIAGLSRLGLNKVEYRREYCSIAPITKEAPPSEG